LQDTTPTLFGGLLTLRFLLPGDSFKVGLGTQCRPLPLLRTFCGFNSGELVDDVGVFLCSPLALVSHLDEITHSSGLLGGDGLRGFLDVHKLIGPTQFLGSQPTALLFLLKRKQVGLFKRSYVATLCGPQALTLTGCCLRFLLVTGDICTDSALPCTGCLHC
jgi:hypothetical protein